MFRAILLFILAFGSSVFASRQEMIPENLATTSAQVTLGRGYLPKTSEVSVGGCATGGWNLVNETTAIKPFATPVFYKLQTGVKVVYTAVSSHRQNWTVKPAQYRNEPVCGSQYIAGVLLGSKLVLSFNYWTTVDQVDKLEELLKANLTDMHSVFNFNPATAGIKMNGFGLLYDGSGATDKLSRYNLICQWNNKDCENYIAEAYDDADNLDLPRPTPADDVISFVVDDYPAN